MFIMNKRRIAVVTLMVTLLTFTIGIYVNPIKAHASGLSGGYTQIERVDFNIGSNQQETMEIPYMLTSTDQSYGWELEISNLKKHSTGSLVGVYNGSANKRTGYLFESSSYNEGEFALAIGGTHYKSTSDSFFIITANSDTKTKITTTINGTSKTFSVSDNASQSISNSYEGDLLTDKTFLLTSCANEIDATGNSEFMGFYFYGVKIKDASGNTVVDMVPAKDSEEKEGAYDRISGNFYPKFVLNNTSYSLIVDNQDGIVDSPYSTTFKNGQTMEDIPHAYIPVKQGMYFNGYYSGENGTGTKYFDKNGSFCQGRAAFGNGNVTLYAYWTEKPPVSADTHECHFEWQVIERPTLEKDGLEGEMCTCGRVGMTQPLSAYVYALNYYATPLIESAKPGQTVVLELGVWNSFPKAFMEKVAAKSAEGVNFVFHYNWKNVKQEITIPAGKTFDLNMDWYGPATMNTLFGEL